MTTLVDTHCHVDYVNRAGEPADVVLARATEAGVGWMVNPGVTPEHYWDILALCDRFPQLYAGLAVHPTDVAEAPDGWAAEVEAHLKHPKVVALGETGLDFYREEHQTPEHMALQHRCFAQTLELAEAHNLPVIVHDRDAHQAIYDTVKLFAGRVRGVMHCFSGDADFARTMIDLGFYISFAGNVTFKNAKALQAAAVEVPLDWLLVETDSPFLSPMPFRGQPNEPARVRLVAEKIAELKGMSIEAIAEVTTRNAENLFKVSASC